jgi:hypothetical protein
MTYSRKHNNQRNNVTCDLKSEIDRIVSKIEAKAERRKSKRGELTNKWEEIVPPDIALHTVCVIYDKQDKKIVVVYADSPIYVTEIELQKEQYRQLLEVKTNGEINEIRTRVSFEQKH